MTNNTQLVSLPRELLESALVVVTRNCTSNWSSRIKEELTAALAAPAEDVRAVVEEPVYMYRCKGFDSWATCDRKRFDLLSVHNCFEVDTLYRRVNACLDAVEEMKK